jgi:hypothetical protein
MTHFSNTVIIDDLQGTTPEVWGAAKRLQGNRREIFTLLGLLIDFSSNLADKVKFAPIVVAPTKPLAGDPWEGFAGFFLDELRASDFVTGFRDAYEAWQELRKVSEPDFRLDPNPEFPPDPFPTDWTSDAGLKTKYDDAQKRFEDRISTVIGTAVAGPLWGPIAHLLPLGHFIGRFLS